VADLVFNIAKGRVVELYNRIEANDPANSALIVVAINSTETDATMLDIDDLAALLALGSCAEATNSGYSRQVLSNAELASLPAPDDGNDRYDVSIPTVTFSSIVAGSAWTDLVICYDSDTTGGADSAIIPLTLHDFAQTPNGSNIVVTAGVFFRASNV
jgi:hypothetical protein